MKAHEPIKLEDSILSYRSKEKFYLFLFLSKDWYKLKPWTYEGEEVPYFCNRTMERDYGKMVTTFLGPFAILYYKVK